MYITMDRRAAYAASSAVTGSASASAVLWAAAATVGRSTSTAHFDVVCGKRLLVCFWVLCLEI